MKPYIQKKICVVGLLVGVIVFSMSAQNTVYAQPPTGGFDGITDSTLICVKTGIPFVWLRNAPSSYAAPIMTLYPQDYSKLITTQSLQSDKVQFWLLVEAFPSATRFGTGWVEVNSLTSQCAPNSPYVPSHPNWDGKIVCIKPGVPFVWEREAPSSYAPSRNTIVHADCLPSSNRLPTFQQFAFDAGYYWDGVQWWVHLGAPPRVSSFEFWIEMNSLYPSS